MVIIQTGFEEFFGSPRRSQLGLGSGVIVAPEGYLLTNQRILVDHRTAREIENRRPRLHRAELGSALAEQRVRADAAAGAKC